MGYQKLQIIPLKKNVTAATRDPGLDTSEGISCQFNPDTIKMSKSNHYTRRHKSGKSTQKSEFSGGNSGSMSLELVFDSTGESSLLNPNKPIDVSKKYINLIKFALVKPSQNPDQNGEPRQVIVQWGNFMSYIAVIESISQNFTYFAPDGTPLRANVTVELRQVFDNNDSGLGSTNPTSRSEARQTWVVEKGQRIEWIAYTVFGATSAWRHLAETNNLLNPAVLRPGQILKVVPLP